ncbi:MAG: PhoH family protein [Elusimicrobiota bacterium]
MNENNQSYKQKIDFQNQEEALAAFGEYDENLKELEKKNNVVIHARGQSATVFGRKEEVEDAIRELSRLKKRQGTRNTRPTAKALLSTPTGKSITPQGANQKAYLKAMRTKDLVVSIGPAGTGKTFLACAEAVNCLERGEVERVVLTRPVVEAGEKLGFLPGDLYEKINPYLKPLYDAFYALIGPVKFQKYRKDEVIEIVPLAYMRGRTLDDALVILDEAQNTSTGQMQMFLTRLGFNSKAIITGDITQVDLEKGQTSGLIEIQEVLKEIEEVEFIYFTKADVLRHKLVKRIIDAYYKFKRDKRK